MPRLLQLDETPGVPLYRRLRRAITDAIEAGHYDDGQALPSTRRLAEDLGVSRNTVNTAYQELVAEGFLESLPRRGHVVNRELRRQRRVVIDADRSDVDWSRRLLAPSERFGRVEKPPEWARARYPFVFGQPDLGQFPRRAWQRAVKRALADDHAAASLHDLVDRDDELLVSMLCRHVLPGRGIDATPDRVLVTTGSQHGLFLVGQALLGPKSRVGVEEPGYPDVRHIFHRAGAELVPLRVDDQGVTAPAASARIDLLAVTPSHHYPTNVTLAAGRRAALLDSAGRHDFLIVEDDYDSEFRYQGRPTPALKAADVAGRVIHVGSFSKFLAPGLRLGFLVASAPLIAHLRDARRYMLRHPSGLSQRALALMIESGDYTHSVRRTRNALRQKWERIVDAIEHHLPWNVPIPSGGTSIWVEGPHSLDARRLARRAAARGVVFEQGDVCFLRRRPPRNHFKLGYAAIPLDRIEPGIEELAAAIAELD